MQRVYGHLPFPISSDVLALREPAEESIWILSDSPELKKARGCLRAFDTDMSAFKKITDNLQETDSKEVPGQVTISAELDKLGAPTTTEVINGVNVQYYAPDSQIKYWQYLIDSTFGKNKNNGGQ